MNIRWRHYALCSLAGLCFAAAQAPLGIWPLVLVGFALSVRLVKAASDARQALWTGWAIGSVYFGASLTWIVEPFLVDFAATGWMAPFALILMAGGLAIFWAFPFWVAARLGRPASLIALWPLAEIARATVFTGFPWGLNAYAWIDTPLAQLAAYVGPHGLGALTLAAAATPILWKPRAGTVFALVALITMSGVGHLRLNTAPETQPTAPLVRLTQPNAPQHQKWDPAFAPIFFRRLLTATETDPRPDLIVWPETSLPTWLNDADGPLELITQAAAGTPVLIGAQRYEGERSYNSLVLLAADGTIQQTYDKHHLVPFGEYLPLAPLLNRLGLKTLTRSLSGFTPGEGPQLLDLGPLGTILPLICYEAVFPRDAKAPGARADFLLHVTNDAWFGTRSGPYQHLVQARFRAIEQGLPLLRSANTGISASIDARGRVLEHIALGQAGYIDTPLPAADNAPFYARYGDFPVIFALFFLLCATLLPYRRAKH